MNPDTAFQIVNPLALAGWVALLAAPIAPRRADQLASVVIPGILALGYAALILAFWSGARGGFSNLSDVMMLFTEPRIALAGWVHYLAFDLAIGAWEVRTARARRIPHALVVPCLILTFLFGPAGFLSFLTLCAVTAPRAAASHA